MTKLKQALVEVIITSTKTLLHHDNLHHFMISLFDLRELREAQHSRGKRRQIPKPEITNGCSVKQPPACITM